MTAYDTLITPRAIPNATLCRENEMIEAAARKMDVANGSETDLMRLMGWKSPQMLRRTRPRWPTSALERPIDASASAIASERRSRGALVRAGADRGGQLRLDQRLIQRLGRRSDAVIDVGNFERLEKFEQGRLVQGHRVAFLFDVILGGFTQKIHAVAPRTPAPRRRAQSLRPATPLPGTSPPQPDRS